MELRKKVVVQWLCANNSSFPALIIMPIFNLIIHITQPYPFLSPFPGHNLSDDMEWVSDLQHPVGLIVM